MLTETVAEKKIESPSDKSRENGVQGEILSSKEAVLPYLQTLFFEERLIEVQIDHTTRIFFATLWDNLPELIEKEVNGETVFTEPEYQAGSYLKDFKHINLSPLEPTSGNIKIHHSKTLTLRFYTGTTAVELDTSFQSRATIRGEHLLKLDFPDKGYFNRNRRPFRAKTPEDYELNVMVSPPGKSSAGRECRIIDLSPNGLSFDSTQLPQSYDNGAALHLLLDPSSGEPIEVTGIVRHYAKIRTKQGNMQICGVQFDLESRKLAAKLESRYANLQRVFLRSLSEKSEGQQIDFKLF